MTSDREKYEEVFEERMSQELRDALIASLDDQVHEEKSAEASNINNDGLDAQMEYLGLSLSQVIDNNDADLPGVERWVLFAQDEEGGRKVVEEDTLPEGMKPDEVLKLLMELYWDPDYDRAQLIGVVEKR